MTPQAAHDLHRLVNDFHIFLFMFSIFVGISMARAWTRK